MKTPPERAAADAAAADLDGDGREDANARASAGRDGGTLTREQVRRVDRIAIERYGVPGIVLMENAARGVVAAIRDAGLVRRAVVILCGGGNNGGDGLAVARHLHNAGARVTIGLCADPDQYAGDAAVNWRVVRAMRLPTVPATPEWLLDEVLGVAASDPVSRPPRVGEPRPGLSRAGVPLPEAAKQAEVGTPPPLVLDAIFGTGLTRPPRDPFPGLADALNYARSARGVPVVAVDLPSGLDCDTGRPLGPKAVEADLTVTFVAEKVGFRSPGASAYTGRVVVADIGCPIEVLDEVWRSA